jgi:hypothetical protein
MPTLFGCGCGFGRGVRSARSPTSSLVNSTAPLLLQLSDRELKKVLEKNNGNNEKEDEIRTFEKKLKHTKESPICFKTFA